jgi:hypothetical protein
MWFCPVNEMIELVSGIPAPQFGGEFSWVRGSELVQGSSGSCVSFRMMQDAFAYPVRCLRTSPGVRVSQVLDNVRASMSHKPMGLQGLL